MENHNEFSPRLLGRAGLFAGCYPERRLLSGWFEDFLKHYNRAGQGLAFAA